VVVDPGAGLPDGVELAPADLDAVGRDASVADVEDGVAVRGARERLDAEELAAVSVDADDGVVATPGGEAASVEAQAIVVIVRLELPECAYAVRGARAVAAVDVADDRGRLTGEV
jgi:hypothetical protein